MNFKGRPSVVPSLATVPSSKEEEENGEKETVGNGEKEQEQSVQQMDKENRGKFLVK